MGNCNARRRVRLKEAARAVELQSHPTEMQERIIAEDFVFQYWVHLCKIPSSVMFMQDPAVVDNVGVVSVQHWPQESLTVVFHNRLAACLYATGKSTLCSVCSEECQTQTACKHALCSSCADIWVKTKVKESSIPSCPLCRTEMRQTEFKITLRGEVYDAITHCKTSADVVCEAEPFGANENGCLISFSVPGMDCDNASTWSRDSDNY